MKMLQLLPVESDYHLVHPEEFHHLDPSASALAIFTDFKKHVPQSVSSNLAAVHAESLMRKTHVRMKVAVDESGELVGVLSLHELDDQRFSQVRHAEQIKHDEVLVQHLMIPRQNLMALDYSELVNSNIEQVLETLKQNKQQHCLVIDRDNSQIRGLISATDIARRLHIPLEIERPTTFFDIFMAIKH